MLKVSKNAEGRPEIFHSIQGEGANIGKPAVFLRLGFCNLKCTWCDAKYTWDWTTNKAKEQLVELSLEEIEREILNYNCKYLRGHWRGAINAAETADPSTNGFKKSEFFY